MVQTAVKLVLEPIFEADFDDSAYGYRPKRSAADAVRAVHDALCDGYTDVVDADLSKYFDTIPHQELLQSVARRVVDRHLLHLLKMWLKTPVEERDDRGGRHKSGGQRNHAPYAKGNFGRIRGHGSRPTAADCSRPAVRKAQGWSGG